MVLRLLRGSFPAARYRASISLAVTAEKSSVKLTLIQLASNSAVRRRVFGPKAGDIGRNFVFNVDQLSFWIKKANSSSLSLNSQLWLLPAQHRRNNPDVFIHIGHLVGTKLPCSADGEPSPEASVDARPGANALRVARPLAATGAIRFDGINTPVPRRIRLVLTAVAPMATKISALSTCVS